MYIALSRDGEGTKFDKATKRLQDVNEIPIGRHHENPILDTRVYELEYLDEYKAPIAANTIS